MRGKKKLSFKRKQQLKKIRHMFDKIVEEDFIDILKTLTIDKPCTT